MRNAYKRRWKPDGKNHLGDLDTDGKRTLKRILETECEGMNGIQMVQDRIQFFDQSNNSKFSRISQYHGVSG
jgi:hypothetical protein